MKKALLLLASLMLLLSLTMSLASCSELAGIVGGEEEENEDVEDKKGSDKDSEEGSDEEEESGAPSEKNPEEKLPEDETSGEKPAPETPDDEDPDVETETPEETVKYPTILGVMLTEDGEPSYIVTLPREEYVTIVIAMSTDEELDIINVWLNDVHYEVENLTMRDGVDLATIRVGAIAETGYDLQVGYVCGELSASTSMIIHISRAPADPYEGEYEKLLSELASDGNETKILRVAVAPDYAPYIFVDRNKPLSEWICGSDVLLAKYIAKELGYKLVFVPCVFDASLNTLLDGEADIAISAYTVTEERKESFLVSSVYTREFFLLDEGTEIYDYAVMIDPDREDLLNGINDVLETLKSEYGGYGYFLTLARSYAKTANVDELGFDCEGNKISDS